ncbi:restriction endonuclease subunit S [Gemmiger formicilis]|uniref:restriction endonuclease subunit S n=1 Tax=Gemmiger formicilis TaxID=745368 RepID=UPI001C00F2F6|nr:restriction endonuclease subunit S [Gemmiger formicilis]MBT9673633.1 restriction endonuclease subunit S [Gemmiger formicilis]
MTEWIECTLDKLGEIVGGATPSTKCEDYYGGSIPWITPKDLSSFKGRYITSGERNITEKGLASCSAQMMPKDAVLFTSRAPIGYVAIASQSVCTNQGFKSIVVNEKADPLFVYYLLKYNKDAIEAMGSGTTFKEVSGKTMRAVKVRIPLDVSYQKRIAAVLDSLDTKIENNERINDNLYAQAKAIFDNHFINIDAIPAGWRKGNLLDIANYLNGLAMQKFRPQGHEIGLPVLKIKELRQGSCDDSSELCSLSIKPEYIIHNGDVIFSWSGSLLVDIWCGGTCGLNQHLFKVTSDVYDKWFYYLWTAHHLARFIAIAADKATTMGHIKREELAKAEVLIPCEEDYTSFNSIMQPIFELIISNRIESRKLAALRDELLPKLMTGEIDVSDVQF